MALPAKSLFDRPCSTGLFNREGYSLTYISSCCKVSSLWLALDDLLPTVSRVGCIHGQRFCKLREEVRHRFVVVVVVVVVKSVVVVVVVVVVVAVSFLELATLFTSVPRYPE
jgi:hypothetical protein